MPKTKETRKCICEICKEEFVPRAQVKRPKACNKKLCQLKRQRRNEREWHNKNKGLYDRKYHNLMKQKRIIKIKEYTNKLIEILQTGQRYLNKVLKIETIKLYFFKFFKELGLRKINKLCIDDSKLLEELTE